MNDSTLSAIPIPVDIYVGVSPPEGNIFDNESYPRLVVNDNLISAELNDSGQDIYRFWAVVNQAVTIDLANVSSGADLRLAILADPGKMPRPRWRKLTIHRRVSVSLSSVGILPIQGGSMSWRKQLPPINLPSPTALKRRVTNSMRTDLRTMTPPISPDGSHGGTVNFRNIIFMIKGMKTGASFTEWQTIPTKFRSLTKG